jgi:hypothetical protein
MYKDTTKEKRYGTILRGLVESLDGQDTLQLEYWSQIARNVLNMEMDEENNLSIRPFITELDNILESDWIVEMKDENIYGYYIYFIRLSNKQANLSVDRKGWVKTPIFLRRSINSGIYLDVENVPPPMPTTIRMSGFVFLTDGGEKKGDCGTCCHRVDSSMTSQNVTCAIPSCEYEPVDDIIGRVSAPL